MAERSTNDEVLYFNGVNGATGSYGMPPMTGEELSTFIQGEARPENLDELQFRYQLSTQQHFGVKEGVDPKKLDEAGWGIVFAHDADPAIKEALSDLLKLRQEQAGGTFKIYEGGEGYRPGESKSKFLARHGAGPGPADPAKVPYYLLIVGSPEAIPYPFQYQLDVQYAVGRLAFATPQEYANYAQSVVAVETGSVHLPRQVSFFGVANADDKATTLSNEQLLLPLAEKLKAAKPDWRLMTFVQEQATKTRLTRLLGGDDTPALLFTASHGMEFPLHDTRQVPHQGALLCQDWPGPQAWQKALPQDFYFAGDDLTDTARLLGLLTFHFACYGAGTPLNDEFSKLAFKTRQAIAPHPFVAGLPSRMLGHPRGGALAVIGHVERAWGYSFAWPGAGSQTTVFESTLARLFDGYPVGAATEYFNERYAELASDLSTELEEIEYGKRVNPYDLAGMWTANNDARSYVIIGDPAVRLPVAAAEQEVMARPALDITTVATRPSAQALAENGPSAAPAQQPETPTSSSAPDEAGVAFGVPDVDHLPDALRDVFQKLAEVLTKTVETLSHLDVQTYTSADLSRVYDDQASGAFSDAATLRARTRITLDGKVLNLIPEPASAPPAGDDDRTHAALDEQVWTMHLETVRLAQKNRVALVRALTELLATLK
jgi:hypothetical protein